jgi:CheY-like chemotaxis protein
MTSLQAHPTGASISQETADILAQFAGKRVLFVDDEAINCLRMQRALRDAGIAVVKTACDGEEALARHEAEPFDIILLNEIMPRMRGTGVLSQLRRRGDHVPIIMHSACTLADIERQYGGQLPASRFVQSPFVEADYVEAVRAVVLEADVARRMRENSSGEGKRQ